VGLIGPDDRCCPYSAFGLAARGDQNGRNSDRKICCVRMGSIPSRHVRTFTPSRCGSDEACGGTSWNGANPRSGWRTGRPRRLRLAVLCEGDRRCWHGAGSGSQERGADEIADRAHAAIVPTIERLNRRVPIRAGLIRIVGMAHRLRNQHRSDRVGPCPSRIDGRHGCEGRGDPTCQH
jgi:hypothetical protein